MQTTNKTELKQMRFIFRLAAWPKYTTEYILFHTAEETLHFLSTNRNWTVGYGTIDVEFENDNFGWTGFPKATKVLKVDGTNFYSWSSCNEGLK